jgi:alkyldihydroxyacetonephosphate synthase
MTAFDKMVCQVYSHWVDACRHELGGLIDDRLDFRVLHAVDAWPLAVKRLQAGIDLRVPQAIARPVSTDDVVRILVWASQQGVPVVPWGGGSSVTGAPLARTDALVLDLCGLDRIIDLDLENGSVRVGAGVMGGNLEDALARHGLTSWFSPQSLHRSTVGGWVATRATGHFSSRWGGIEDAVLELVVVLADGSVLRLGTPPRGSVGPDLKELFIGSEGALGVVVEIVLKTYPRTEIRDLEALALPDVNTGVGALRELMQAGLRPPLLRLYDADEASHLAIQGLPPNAVLLVGFTGAAIVADAERVASLEILGKFGARSLGPGPAEAWLANRYDFSRVERLLAEPGGYAETIEIAAGWRGIMPAYLALKAALAPMADEVLGHFSHSYVNGISLYLIVLGRALDDTEAVRRLELVWSTTMEIALAHGAVISHHHGVGQARSAYLGAQLGKGAALLTALKHALDPHGILHPGSLVPESAYR